MNKFSQLKYILLALGIFLYFFPEQVYAYGGPGSVISTIGALLAAIASIIVAIFGFLWFPIKRLFRNDDKEVEEGDKKQSQK